MPIAMNSIMSFSGSCDFILKHMSFFIWNSEIAILLIDFEYCEN
jgi:hypothetical protein